MSGSPATSSPTSVAVLSAGLGRRSALPTGLNTGTPSSLLCQYNVQLCLPSETSWAWWEPGCCTSLVCTVTGWPGGAGAGLGEAGGEDTDTGGGDSG